MRWIAFETNRCLTLLVSTFFLWCTSGTTFAEEKITVAVLPFFASIDDKDLEGLDRALSEMLMTDLSRLQSIQIVERQRLGDVMKEMNLAREGFIDPSTAARIGQGVGARTILTGSFYAKGEKLRIDARLIHVETGTVLVAEEITGSVEDPFALEKNLQAKLVEAMGLRLSALEAADLSAKPAADAKAAAAYGRAEALNEQGDVDAAKKEAATALQISPDFKQAQKLLDDIEARLSQVEQQVESVRGDISEVKEVRLKRIRESSSDEEITGFLDDEDHQIRTAALKGLRGNRDRVAEIAGEWHGWPGKKSGDWNQETWPWEKYVEQTEYHAVAVAKLADQEQLLQILQENWNPWLKSISLGKLYRPDLLEKALGDCGRTMSYWEGTEPLEVAMDFWEDSLDEAYAKITDPQQIARIASQGRVQMFKHVKDENLLSRIALDPEKYWTVRHEALKTISDPKLLGSILSVFPNFYTEYLLGHSNAQQVAESIALGQTIAHDDMPEGLDAAFYEREPEKPKPEASRTAILFLRDGARLARVALQQKDPDLKLLAVSRISDVGLLGDLRQKLADETCQKQIDELIEIASLGDAEKTARLGKLDEMVQTTVVMTINDPQTLKSIASQSRVPQEVAAEAVRRLNDIGALKDVFLTCDNGVTRTMVYEKILDMPDSPEKQEILVQAALDEPGKKERLFLQEREEGQDTWALQKLGFSLITDVERLKSRYSDSRDNEVQKILIQQLGPSYVTEQVNKALKSRTHAPEAIITACNNQELLCRYFDSLKLPEQDSVGFADKMRSERALVAKLENPDRLLRTALHHNDWECRRIAVGKLKTKDDLSRVKRESFFYDAQDWASERLKNKPL
jgi:TolB-like protein